MSTTAPPIPSYRLDVHLDPATNRERAAQEVWEGLSASPRWLSPKHFYDERGCELFEAITRLPEYYQTRTELSILREMAPGLIAWAEPSELVEIGSGSSHKTGALLDPMRTRGVLRRYIPFDIAPGALLAASARVAEGFPGIEVHAIGGDFTAHLDRIPEAGEGRRLVAFLGGTIGNLWPDARQAFLTEIRGLMAPGDLLLIGTDLAGDVNLLESAYNDSQGITAAFNLNVLPAMNCLMGGDFDPNGFEHVAFFNHQHSWIEMRLRSLREQRVSLAAINRSMELAKGEEIRTEISCKFTREEVSEMYLDAGLKLVEWHTDPGHRYAVSVATAR